MAEKKDETKKKTSWNWLLWWLVDPTELATEVEKYPSRNPLKTARGVGALCLLLSVVITLACVAFKIVAASAVLDASISLLLAAFIYFGHRWAMLAAMAWWTLEKVVSIVDAFQGAATAGAQFIPQVIWWCVYMHAFWLAFRVEQARRKPAAVAVNVFD